MRLVFREEGIVCGYIHQDFEQLFRKHVSITLRNGGLGLGSG